MRFLPWLKFFLPGLLILNSWTIQGQNCQASFSYSVSDYIVHFSNSSYNYGSTTKCWWNFGDYSYSSREHPIHAFSSPGKYKVCLLIVDTVNNCNSTWCDSITITAQSPGCKADFSVKQKDLYVEFYQLCTGVNSSPTYNWDFGDGLFSSYSNPDHHYTRDGIYYVKLTVASSNCNDSISQTVIVKDPTPCSSKFTYVLGGDSIYFSNDTTHRYAQYTWDFGDGKQSKKSNPVHKFTTNGMYQVCLQVVDSFSGCNSFFCDSIKISHLPECRASFDYTVVDKTVYLTSTSTGNLSHYYWDFGDGSTSWEQNPNHTYIKYGKFKIYHYISDSLYQCTSNYTDFVEIVHPAKFGSISGRVTVNFKVIDAAQVWLIAIDGLTGKFSVIDSFLVDSTSIGNFYFDNVPSGIYTLKAFPGAFSKYCLQFAPTYAGQKLTWDKSLLLYLNTNPISQDIELLKIKKVSSGSNQIPGLIYEDPTRNAGRIIGMEHVPVNIINKKGELVQVIWTQPDGGFISDSLGVDEYEIWPEIPGKTTYSSFRSFNQQSQVSDSVFMVVKSQEIVSEMGNGIEKMRPNQEANVWPNPGKGVHIISLPVSHSLSLLTLYDEFGRIIFTSQIVPETEFFEFSSKSMNNGLFFGVLTTNNQVQTFRLLVRD